MGTRLRSGRGRETGPRREVVAGGSFSRAQGGRRARSIVKNSKYRHQRASATVRRGPGEGGSRNQDSSSSPSPRSSSSAPVKSLRATRLSRTSKEVA